MDNPFGVNNIIPENDQERNAALNRYKIMDTAAEQAFDNVAKLAAQIFSVPIALISLVDSDRVFYKANIGLSNITSIERAQSLCSLTILDDKVLVSDQPTGYKFYAGAPLITHDGFRIGTLCIVDTKPKSFFPQDEEILAGLAKVVMDEIDLRLAGISHGQLSQIHKNPDIKNKELRESDNRFKEMIEHAPIAILVLRGSDMVFDIVNPMMQKLLNKGPDLIGKTIRSGLPEILNQSVIEVINHVYQTGQPHYALEVPLVLNRDGLQQTRYFDMVYTPLTEDGKVTGILQVATEITAQIAIRKQLQKSEEMLRFSIESANVGTWYFDLETETFNPSPSLKKLFGFRGDEVMTYQDILVQINEDYRTKVIAAASGTIYKGANYNVEFPATGFHDQKVRWLKAIGKLDHDADGKLSHFSGVVIEITEQKQDEIRKNDFIAMVSHELKTPLTSLKGYMQLLTSKAKKTEDAFTIGALERGNTQITKMTAMINGFLNVSRFQAGKIHLDKKPFALNQLINDIVEEFTMTTQSHEIILMPVAPIVINADADKVGQVINNFLSNAVKYSPLGSRIEVAAKESDNSVQVSVKDEGMGINPEDIDKLFERFYRVENQHAQNISGFGIGLYLCAEIVNRHDGKIWVVSESGKGSTFYFSVPRYKKS